MSEEDFGEAVQAALGSIPRDFQPYLENVIIEVQRRPTRQILESLRLPNDRSLLGVYLGRPMTRKSVEESAVLPDRVILFQDNLERMCRTTEQLVREIRRTVLHEVGHHFGLDEDQLDRLGYG